MKFTKKLLLATGVFIIAMQFIRPTPNKTELNLKNDFLNLGYPSDSIKHLFRSACYDCHSNYTAYPWYTNFQPIGWIMDKHIKEGKEELNFNVFAGYSKRKQISKLNNIANSIKDDYMPLSSYKLMHANANLNETEKMMMINWALTLKDSLSSHN